MPKVTKPANVKGEFLVDYEEKVFEDVKADPGEKALVTFHTVAFEGSIGFVNLLQATRLQRKGFETSVLLYGPGVTLGAKSIEIGPTGDPVQGIKRHPEIGDHVTIYAHATILGGDTRIGANSVVTENVPPMAIFAGVPARLIRFRS